MNVGVVFGNEPVGVNTGGAGGFDVVFPVVDEEALFPLDAEFFQCLEIDGRIGFAAAHLIRKKQSGRTVKKAGPVAFDGVDVVFGDVTERVNRQAARNGVQEEFPAGLIDSEHFLPNANQRVDRPGETFGFVQIIDKGLIADDALFDGVVHFEVALRRRLDRRAGVRGNLFEQNLKVKVHQHIADVEKEVFFVHKPAEFPDIGKMSNKNFQTLEFPAGCARADSRRFSC